MFLLRDQQLGHRGCHQPHAEPGGGQLQMDGPGPGHPERDRQQLQLHRPRYDRRPERQCLAGFRVFLVGHQDDRHRPRHRQTIGLQQDHLFPRLQGRRRHRGGIPHPTWKLLLPFHLLGYLLPGGEQHLQHADGPGHRNHGAIRRRGGNRPDEQRRDRASFILRAIHRPGRRGSLPGRPPQLFRPPLLRRQP